MAWPRRAVTAANALPVTKVPIAAARAIFLKIDLLMMTPPVVKQSGTNDANDDGYLTAITSVAAAGTPISFSGGDEKVWAAAGIAGASFGVARPAVRTTMS